MSSEESSEQRREARRSRLLESREERLAKILGSVSKSDNTDNTSVKSDTKSSKSTTSDVKSSKSSEAKSSKGTTISKTGKNTPSPQPKPSTDESSNTNLRQRTAAKTAEADDRTRLLQDESSNRDNQIPTDSRAKKISHIFVIVAAALGIYCWAQRQESLDCFVAYALAPPTSCKINLNTTVGGVEAWVFVFGVFALVEAVEALRGKLGKSQGSRWSIAVVFKDLCLFVTTLLCLVQFTTYGKMSEVGL